MATLNTVRNVMGWLGAPLTTVRSVTSKASDRKALEGIHSKVAATQVDSVFSN